jgi:hypothetical protein
VMQCHVPLFYELWLCNSSLFFDFLVQDPCWEKCEIKEELKNEVSLEGDGECVDRLVQTDLCTHAVAYSYK